MGASPVFVVQRHKATNLHYDFRLEIEGILKSWAVPKGPSAAIGEKRLAILVEDHELDYASFEGTIPEGQYGAGTVEIWDKGTYQNIKHDKDNKIVPMSKCIEIGQVEIKLTGKRVVGNYRLVRFREKPKEMWLLFKMKTK